MITAREYSNLLQEVRVHEKISWEESAQLSCTHSSDNDDDDDEAKEVHRARPKMKKTIDT